MKGENGFELFGRSRTLIMFVIFGKQAGSHHLAEVVPNMLEIQHVEGLTGQIGQARQRSLMQVPKAAPNRVAWVHNKHLLLQHVHDVFMKYWERCALRSMKS